MRKQYDYYIQLCGKQEKMKMTKKEAYRKLESLITKQIDEIAGFGISVTDYEHINKIFRKLENGCRAYSIIGLVTVSREPKKLQK